jgi:hypothetical protein
MFDKGSVCSSTAWKVCLEFHILFYFSVNQPKMMTRNGKRRLQEEESQPESNCTKRVSVRVDHEISAQLANTEEHIETESQGTKKSENLPDKSRRFEDFSAEILLKILNFLEISNLLKCSQTSKRIRVICYDDSLWQTINLSKKRVPTEFLQKLIGYGCKSLNLNETYLVGTLRLENESQLTNLDLSGCSARSHVFGELLKSCHYLQKLTFTQPLDFNTLSAVTSQNGKTLEVLNCWWEYKSGRVNGIWTGQNLGLPSIRSIIENCTELKELNFWNGVFYESEDTDYHCAIYRSNVDYLVNNISPDIEKFSAQDGDFRDEHIKILVSRCTKLKELRFSCLSITNDSLTHIIGHLSLTLEKLELTNINIDQEKKLKLMPNSRA